MSDSEFCNLAYENRMNELLRRIAAEPDCVNRKDGVGRVALHWAISAKKLEVFNVLVEKGSPLDVPDTDGWTPLMIACSVGLEEAVHYLIAKGANVNNQNSTGQVPLHYACSKNHLDIVKKLFDNGATVNVQDNMGSTPLHRAVSKGHMKVADYLVTAAKANINMADKYGNTALHLACEEGHRPSVELLLKLGARTDIINREEKYPADLCAERSLAKLVSGDN